VVLAEYAPTAVQGVLLQIAGSLHLAQITHDGGQAARSALSVGVVIA
jgi:hypothetical protein